MLYSVYQSWHNCVLVSPPSVTNGVDEVPVCFGICVCNQGLGWCTTHGPRSSCSDRHAFIHRENRGMGYVINSPHICSMLIANRSADAFVLYIVDVNHASNGGESLLPPPQPDFPSPPPNAISYTNNGSPIPVYYNQTVVLQCLTSGVVSPVLIIRKVDHTTTAVGGGSSEHAKGTADQYCPPGEVCGDPVSQLHKIAFEVFDASTNAPAHGSPGDSGAFLSCMGEKVNTYRPVEGRIWSPRNESPMMSPVISPVSPLTASTSFGSMVDYFNPSGLGNGLGHGLDAPLSPSMEFESNGGGRVRKKRSTSSAGGLRSRGNRRRPASSGSGSLSPTTAHFPDAMVNPYQHAQWQVEIGETSVWTIVGVDQIRYNFYIPPMLLDSSAQHLASHSRSFPVPSKPVTPFPGVVKYLPADRAAEVVRSGHTWRPVTAGPDPSKMLTLYGENFVKTEPPHVFFGADVSPYVEVRCNEVVGCLPPDQDTSNHLNMRRPILLVRADGVVYPSTTLYP
jgi:recombining binding protein (suppressor of hairless)